MGAVTAVGSFDVTGGALRVAQALTNSMATNSKKVKLERLMKWDTMLCG